MFTRLGPEAAQAWLAAAPRVWPRWVAGGLLVVAVGLGVGFEPPCSQTHACSGAYIPVFGVFFGLLVLSALGLWLRPVAGASLGLVVSAIEVLIDPSWQGKAGFVAYGLASVAVLLHVTLGHERQRAVLADVAREWAPLPGTVAASGTARWGWGLVGGAIAAGVVAAAAVGMWMHDAGEDAAHRARSLIVTATVTSGWDADWMQRVEVEETDRSYWLSLAVVAAGVAVGIGAFLRARRRAAEVVADEGVAVEVRVHPSGEALLRPVGGKTPFASFDTGPPRAGMHEPGALRSEGGCGLPWTRGVVVGDFREGAWVQVRTAQGVVTAACPLVAACGDGAGVASFLDTPRAGVRRR